jgi:outer membrane immunogenic protein
MKNLPLFLKHRGGGGFRSIPGWEALMKYLRNLIWAALLFAGPAVAADIPVKAPVKAPPPPLVPIFTWTGFYVGANVGGVTERASGTSDFLDTASAPPFSANPQLNSFSNTRVIGGAQGGYNWQFSPWGVVGLEADWDFTNTGYTFCRQTDITSAACFDNGNGFETIQSQTKWFITTRARFGFLPTPTLLIYGTGGAAWGDVETNLTQNCLVAGCGATSTAISLSSLRTDDIKSGWAAGAGVEWMFAPHWTLRGEWLHIDLGTINNSLSTFGNSGAGSFSTTTTQTTVWSRSERFDEFRAAVNFKF